MLALFLTVFAFFCFSGGLATSRLPCPKSLSNLYERDP